MSTIMADPSTPKASPPTPFTPKASPKTGSPVSPSGSGVHAAPAQLTMHAKQLLDGLDNDKLKQIHKLARTRLVEVQQLEAAITATFDEKTKFESEKMCCEDRMRVLNFEIEQKGILLQRQGQKLATLKRAAQTAEDQLDATGRKQPRVAPLVN